MELVKLWDDDFKCLCGNDSNGEGAYYSDRDGNELDGPASHDDPGYWCCDSCGRIWDAHTGEVLSQREPGYKYLTNRP